MAVRRTWLHQLIKVFSSIFLSWNKNKKFWSNNKGRRHPFHLPAAALVTISTLPVAINPPFCYSSPPDVQFLLLILYILFYPCPSSNVPSIYYRYSRVPSPIRLLYYIHRHHDYMTPQQNRIYIQKHKDSQTHPCTFSNSHTFCKHNFMWKIMLIKDLKLIVCLFLHSFFW